MEPRSQRGSDPDADTYFLDRSVLSAPKFNEESVLSEESVLPEDVSTTVFTGVPLNQKRAPNNPVDTDIDTAEHWSHSGPRAAPPPTREAPKMRLAEPDQATIRPLPPIRDVPKNRPVGRDPEVSNSLPPTRDIPKVRSVERNSEVASSLPPTRDVPKTRPVGRDPEVSNSLPPTRDIPKVRSVGRDPEVASALPPTRDVPKVRPVERNSEVRSASAREVPKVRPVERNSEVRSASAREVPKVRSVELNSGARSASARDASEIRPVEINSGARSVLPHDVPKVRPVERNSVAMRSSPPDVPNVRSVERDHKGTISLPRDVSEIQPVERDLEVMHNKDSQKPRSSNTEVADIVKDSQKHRTSHTDETENGIDSQKHHSGHTDVADVGVKSFLVVKFKKWGIWPVSDGTNPAGNHSSPGVGDENSSSPTDGNDSENDGKHNSATIPIWRFIGDILLLSYSEVKAISLTLAEITAISFTVATYSNSDTVRYFPGESCRMNSGFDLVYFSGYRACLTATNCSFCEDNYEEVKAMVPVKFYWIIRLSFLAFTSVKALLTGTTSRPLAAPLAYSVQSQDSWGAWLQVVFMLIQVIFALVAGIGVLELSESVFVVNIFALILTSIAIVAILQSARFKILAIAQVYVGVMFAISQLLNDAAFASLQQGALSGVMVTVIQVILNTYELARQTTGGYITYFDKVAYIRASDLTTIRKVHALDHLNWVECCNKVVFYTAPWRRTEDVTAHLNQLVSELSTGPFSGTDWFEAVGGSNARAQMQAELLYLPTIDANLAGRLGFSFIYTLKGERFIATTAGDISRTDQVPRTRLNAPWRLH